MTASTPGSYLLERVDRRTVLFAKVKTFAERKKMEDIPRGVVEGKAGVAVGPHNNERERRKS